MEADRWHKIDEIFHAALQRKPEERVSFLEENCAHDTALYADVKALLVSYEEDDSFFEDSVSALAAEMFADRVGETIGPYEVLSQLGSGAMGVVYLAQDVRLGRKIALKLLPSQFTNDKDRLRRFQQEARSASALNHPNILTVHEIGQKAGLHYIATEFVDGVTLRQHIHERRMSLDEVLNIATQVASALQAAHAAGIAHRDIKPENIMIRSDGYIKVLDFGLAKLTENELSPAAETNPGVVMGTPRYMSPEQARGLDVDLRTDIFSLGTVIYELVTGKLPFEGETTSDVIAALIKDEPESMRTTVPELPVEFEQVVSKALAKDRGQRYQTIAEFASALQGLKDEIKLGAPVLTNDGSLNAQTIKTRTATDPQAKQKTESVSLSKGWTLTIALGLIVIVGVVTVLSFRPRRSQLVKNSPSVKEKIESTSRQLTNRDGFISGARFAPEGNSVVYSAGFDGKPLELFYNNGESAEARPAGIESASLESVSHSGKIAVLVDFELNWSDGFNGTLLILPAGGGRPETRIPGVDDAAFAPDGSFAVFRRSFYGEQQLEYPAGTVLYKSPGWMSYPRFSPKGDKIAFFEHPLGDYSGSVVVFDLASKQRTYLLTDWQALKGLAWNPKTNDIWFGGSKVNKTARINSVSLSGQVHEKVYWLPTQNARVEDISDDGRILINRGISNHTTVTMLSGKSQPKDIDTRGAWSTSADLSADGKTLLFYQWGYESSDGSDVSGVYLQRLDGSGPVKLGPGKALALSPDGKWALALQPTKPQPQLILVSTSLGQPKPLSNAGIKEYHFASFFPDGKQILFTGVEAREDAEIRSFVQDVNTGQVYPFTEEGTIALRVSPDGKRVITLQDKTYYIQSLNGGDPKEIPGLEPDDEPIQWSDDGRAVFVKAAGDFATKIYRVDLETGARRKWRDIDPTNKVGHVGLEVNPGGILITPDGKVCIYTYWILLQQILSASID